MDLNDIYNMYQLYDCYKNSTNIVKEDAEQLLAKAFEISIDRMTLRYKLDKGEIKLQSKLIKAALGKQADIQTLYESALLLEALDTQKAVLLTPKTANAFLILALTSPVHVLNADAYQYEISQEKIALQRKLIQEALKVGANLGDSLPEKVFLYADYCLKTLHRNEDILLTPATAQGFLTLASACSIIEWSYQQNQFIPAPEQVQLKAQLLKKAMENGANIDEVISNENFFASADDLLAYKELLNATPMFSPEALLKIALAIPTVDDKEGRIRQYNPKFTQQQKEYVLFAFEKGANITAMDFEDLDLDEISIGVLKILLEHGMDPQFLMSHALNLEDSLAVLSLAQEKQIKIPSYQLVTGLHNGIMDNSTIQFLLENTGFDINAKLSASDLFNEFIERGPQFKERAERTMQEQLKILDILEEGFSFGGTIAHILARNGNLAALQFLMDNYNLDLNALNSKGQTPLFFASTPAVAEFLISHGANSAIEDETGNTWNYYLNELAGGDTLGSDEL